jgi:predicted DNA-binding transcriptional regulator YafY
MGKEEKDDRFLNHLIWLHMPEKCLECIECDNSFAGVMIDRFGKDVSMIRLDDKRFVVNVEVAVSRQFLAWIISLGEGVTLVGPDNVVEMMNIEIDRLIKQYKK